MPVAKPKKPLIPDFDIIINGSRLPTDAESHIIGVTIDDDVGLPGMFILELTGSDHPKKEVVWIDDQNRFAIGNTVEIKMGYRDDLETLIKGEITGLEPAFAFDRLPSLTVRGYDRRHRLHRGRKTRTFVQQKDSDIAAQVGKEAGLNAQVEDTGVVYEYVLQCNQTDMMFLQERAKRIHYEVVVEDKTLFFRPVSNDQSEILTLTMASDLLEFYPRLSTMRQVSEVTVRGWDPKGKQAIVGQMNTGNGVSKMGGQNSGATLIEGAFGSAIGMVSDRPVATQAEADQLAKAHFNEIVLALISGEGVCWGRTDVRPGKVIKIDGVGAQFSGQYYVTSASHRYTPQQGYQTRFSVRRNSS